MASAACIVGSSRFAAAGVPVLDRERLVDFPNDPVSGAIFLALGIFGLPSVLEELDAVHDMALSGFLPRK
jgi:hypothetical protein